MKMIQENMSIRDDRRNERRVLKRDATYAESIFLTLEDAVGKIAAIEEIHDVSTQVRGQHLVCAVREP
ncbi:MAG: hypothetical protein V4657_03695 [Pseudomonadota bacterium]